jgi:hypothetical protein
MNSLIQNAINAISKKNLKDIKIPTAKSSDKEAL